MRDEDDDTKPLRFGATREGVVPLGQQLSDAEDRYFGDSTKMVIERNEYEALVEDSVAVSEMEDALIELIKRVAMLTTRLKMATGRE